VIFILFALWFISFFGTFRVLENLYNPERTNNIQTYVNLFVASLPVFNLILTWVLYRTYEDYND
jgi:hypothetical protein